MLTGMGFESEAAEAALMATGNAALTVTFTLQKHSLAIDEHSAETAL